MIIEEPRKTGLTKNDLLSDPIKKFDEWYRAAIKAETTIPDAMTLTTANEMGRPSVRMVLLRGFDEKGYCFYTNYNSRNSSELSVNPYAALVFDSHISERQIRLEEQGEKIMPGKIGSYFDSRPRGRRLGGCMHHHKVNQLITAVHLKSLLKNFRQHCMARLYNGQIHGVDIA